MLKKSVFTGSQNSLPMLYVYFSHFHLPPSFSQRNQGFNSLDLTRQTELLLRESRLIEVIFFGSTTYFALSHQAQLPEILIRYRVQLFAA